uniref:Uncharacterized protein n=1 Tax=Vibrio vulnificus TaxID=672 RepID=A0A6S4PWV9_VIBVL|nr:hypothetical protein [Vibrio vulnificus]
MRWFRCLRWYAAASVLRCSHLNRALCCHPNVIYPCFFVRLAL